MTCGGTLITNISFHKKLQFSLYFPQYIHWYFTLFFIFVFKNWIWICLNTSCATGKIILADLSKYKLQITNLPSWVPTLERGWQACQDHVLAFQVMLTVIPNLLYLTHECPFSFSAVWVTEGNNFYVLNDHHERHFTRKGSVSHSTTGIACYLRKSI